MKILEQNNKITTTELVPFLRTEGRDFYMSLKYQLDDNTDIFNIIDNMEFKLVIYWKENEESQIKKIFESPEWVKIGITTRENDGFDYYEGNLDIYELTQGGGYLSLKLSDCLADVFPDVDEEENEERIDALECDMIENMTGDGDLDQLLEKAIAQYIKTYF